MLFDQIELEPGTGTVKDVTYAEAAFINGTMRTYPPKAWKNGNMVQRDTLRAEIGNH